MDDMVKYKEEHSLSFPVGMKNESIDSLKIGGFPTTYIIDRNGNIVFSQSGGFRSEEDFEKVVTSLMGDDYQGKQIALYNFTVVDKENGPAPNMQIHLYSDTVDETLTTDEKGMASYFGQGRRQSYGFTSNADNLKVGLESGLKLITISKT